MANKITDRPDNPVGLVIIITCRRARAINGLDDAALLVIDRPFVDVITISGWPDIINRQCVVWIVQGRDIGCGDTQSIPVCRNDPARLVILVFDQFSAMTDCAC